VKESFIIDRKNQSAKTVFNNVVNAIRSLSHEGVLVIELSFKKVTRSYQQNRYFHKLVGLIAEKQGEDLERVKRQIKHKIGLIEKDMVNGELITIIKSTADLSVEEFSQLIEQTITVCQYLEIQYPIPAHYGFDKVAA